MSKYSGLKTLVVDDLDSLRVAIVDLLKGVGFEDVHEANDGNIAFDKLALEHDGGNPFNLILCDINMPNCNGIEFLQKMRADKRFTSVPVLMVSTENETSIVMDAIKAGATNYLIKPFTAQALQEKLEAISKHL